MRSRDVQNEMTDDFEPAGGMKIGPDGFNGSPPPVTYPKDPPRLCNAGPCRNYHTMTIRLDAENGSDGTEVFHTEDHHYCYPGIGIESNLGSLPVLACNRWVPVRKLLRTRSSVRAAYELELEKWKAAHDFDLSDASEAPSQYQITVVTIGPAESARGYHPSGIYPNTMTLAEIAHGFAKGAKHDGLFTVELDGDLIGNTDATLLELGAHEGSTLVITFTSIPGDTSK